MSCVTAWEPSELEPRLQHMDTVTGGREVCNFDEGLARQHEVINPLATDVWAFAPDMASSSNLPKGDSLGGPFGL